MVVSSSVSPPGEPSWIRTRPPDVAPSLHRHYSDFITTTSDSAPVPRIGTQVLVGSPLERLPSHRDDWFPQFRRKAQIRLTPPARRTPPGQPSGQPPDFSRRYHPPSVSMSYTGSRRVNGGSLAFVFLIPPAESCSTCPQRSRPPLLMTAAWGGLKPAPDSRPRRAFRHLPYSLLRRTVIEPHGVADDLRRETITVVARGLTGHSPALPLAPST